MMYVDFSAGGKDYKLRLNTRNIVNLEKQLGFNPVLIFGMDDKNMRYPTVEEMVSVLYCSLIQYNHGIKLDDAYDIFDAWLEDGHMTTDFLAVITEIFQVSGIFGNEKADGGEKNA